MRSKSYIVTHIETQEKSDQIEWEILNCLGIWNVEGMSKYSREVQLWEMVEEYLGTKLKSLEFESNRPHALTSYMQTVYKVAHRWLFYHLCALQ